LPIPDTLRADEVIVTGIESFGMNRPFAVLLFCALCAGCTEPRDLVVCGERPVTFKVEVADNAARHALGLMFRKRLDENRGMLFVYDAPGRRTFWMKNTGIPLDIIFIDPDRRIANIAEAAPCVADPCPAYPSRGEAQFVLEINRGLSRKFGFTEGSRVEFELK
jgi:hypothetical protein